MALSTQRIYMDIPLTDWSLFVSLADKYGWEPHASQPDEELTAAEQAAVEAYLTDRAEKAVERVEAGEYYSHARVAQLAAGYVASLKQAAV